jgi:hypothetical protein
MGDNPGSLAGMPDSAMTQLFRDPPNQPQEAPGCRRLKVLRRMAIYLELGARGTAFRQWAGRQPGLACERVIATIRHAPRGRDPDPSSGLSAADPRVGLALSSCPTALAQRAH